MTNVQSVVTPVIAKAPKAPKASKAKLNGSTAPAPITAEQACEAAYQYGSSLAGLDGSLTVALKAFKDNAPVLDEMLLNLNVGYLVRKLDYDRDYATEVVGLLKYNEKKADDHHRTFEQQRIMDTVRVVWHRAQKMAGIVKPKTDGQVKAEATRAEKEAEKSAHESRLIKADEIVNPKDDTDIFESLTRLVSTMKALQAKHSAKLVGDRGSAWRDWLASAPKK
jgi:hypothetical protein